MSDEETIEKNQILSEFVDLLKSNAAPDLSPQLENRLLHLSEFKFSGHNDQEFVRHLTSVFNRLLLELIQAHYNTKQREQDLVRLINQKKCTISYPDLTDAVIDLLIELHKATEQCADTSFERNVLMKFLLKELRDHRYGKRQVGRVVQTLYRSSCFHVEEKIDAPGRLKLKKDLCNAEELRRHHDVEMIKFAQANGIRLSPESWVHLLCRHSYPDNLSRLQSLLDKHQTPVSVSELQLSMSKMGDKYGLSNFMRFLERIENLMEVLSSKTVTIDPGILRDIMMNLVNIKPLFIIRQRRGRLQS